MYQTIHEDVEVAGVFKQGQFVPKRFLWAKNQYDIQEITMKIKILEYGEATLIYSCMIRQIQAVARLSFNLKSHHWKIEEIWNEG